MIEMTAVSTCPSTVAIAAPFIPILRGKMKIGSRIILSTAPDVMAAIA